MEPTISAPTKGYNDYFASQKKRWPWIVAAIVLLALAIGFAAWKFWSTDDASDQAQAEVSITAQGFSPAAIKIKQGQDVMWTNTDAAAHQVYADPEQVADLDSQEPLAEGDAYIFTFDKTGTFNYYDPLNPSLKATVIVE